MKGRLIGTSKVGTDLFKQVNLVMVIAFVLFLPFNNRYITYLILAWGIGAVVMAKLAGLRIKRIIEFSSPYLLFYLIALISLTYSQDVVGGIKILETMASLVVFPFLILTLKEAIGSKTWQFKYIMDAYLIGLVIYILFSIVALFLKWDMQQISDYFETQSLVSAKSFSKLSFLHHRTYISMYIIWGIILIMNRIFQPNSTKGLMVLVILVLVYAAYVIMLGSRAALLTLVLITLFYLWKWLNRYTLMASIGVVLVVLVTAAIVLFKYTRIGNTVKRINVMENSMPDNRIPLWQDAFAVITEAPIFGHGIGDGINKMVSMHMENDNTVAANVKANAHNQFMETTAQTGIIGLISLLIILFVPLVQAIKKKHELLALMIAILFINFLFESMLVRLAGVLFMAFWLNMINLFPHEFQTAK